MTKEEIIKKIETIHRWITGSIEQMGTPFFNPDGLKKLTEELSELHFKLADIYEESFENEDK